MPTRRFVNYLLLFFVLVIFLQTKGYLTTVTDWLSQGLTPLTKAVYNFGQNLTRISSQVINGKNFYAENQALKNELARAAANEASLKMLREENQHLRQELNFVKKERKFLAAEIVGKNADDLASALIINRGERDGVALGSPVVVDGGLLIGKIIKVAGSHSLVRLLTDNQSKIAASVLNADKTIGIVSGGHGTSITLEMIPQNETVNNGDLIVTSGLDQSMPRGLLLGKIDSITKDLYEPFQHASITPLVNPEKSTVVVILLP